MPEISRWNGIVVTMYWKDHARPHFHARYSGDNAVYSLYQMDFAEGELPNTQENQIREWATMHKDELLANWERAETGKPISKIEPYR